MARIPNKHGGGAQTNRNRLHDVVNIGWHILLKGFMDYAESWREETVPKFV